MNDKEEFDKEYLNVFPPPSLLGWLEDFVRQLDCPLPELTSDVGENFKRFGAWETQQAVLKKLRYAISVEKERLKKD